MLPISWDGRNQLHPQPQRFGACGCTRPGSHWISGAGDEPFSPDCTRPHSWQWHLLTTDESWRRRKWCRTDRSISFTSHHLQTIYKQITKPSGSFVTLKYSNIFHNQALPMQLQLPGAMSQTCSRVSGMSTMPSLQQNQECPLKGNIYCVITYTSIQLIHTPGQNPLRSTAAGTNGDSIMVLCKCY